MINSAPSNNKALAFSHLLVFFSCLALIIIYTLSNFFIEPVSSYSFWLLKTIPLLLFLPAIYAKKIRSYQWLCFLILIYFIQGILDIFSADKVTQGILETFFTLLLFSAAVYYIHGCQKLAKNKAALIAQAAPEPE